MMNYTINFSNNTFRDNASCIKVVYNEHSKRSVEINCSDKQQNNGEKKKRNRKQRSKH